MHDLLPLFVNGRLKGDQVAEFRLHLENCATCRDELAFAESVAIGADTHGGDFFELHPTPEALVAATRGDLADDQTARIHRHLEFCADCNTEANWVSGRSVAGEGVPPPTRSRMGVSGWTGWLVAAAATIAFVTLSLQGPGEGRSITGRTHTGFLRPVERDSAEVTTLALAPEDSAFVVLIEVDLPNSGFPVKIEITNASGDSVHVATGVDRDALGDELYYAFPCELRDCPPGEYDLVLTSADPEEPDLTGRFEVTRR